jgi:hypothetical protein
MDHVKHFFDILDYATFRAFLYAMLIIGVISLIKNHHR